jgi:uncharacterized protein YjdB
MTRAPGITRLILFLLFAALACDTSDPIDPGTAPVFAVTVAPDSTELQVGQALQLVAKTWSERGRMVEGRVVVWHSADTLTAQVNAFGVVVARRAGVVRIDAISEGMTGQARITIPSNPAPAATALTPASALAGSGPVLLVVTGTGFVPGALVQWNGQPRATTWQSTTQLHAQISAVDVSQVGGAQVTVVNPAPGGGASAALTFTISQVPVASVQVEPATATVQIGATFALAARTLDAHGQELHRPVLWTSSDTTKATVSPTGVVSGRAAGAVTITATSEGHSANAALQVEAAPPPPPVITSLEPAATEATEDGFQIRIHGTGFGPNSYAAWNGFSHPVDHVSDTELVMYLWPGNIRLSGTGEVSVYNLVNGELVQSNRVTFTILPSPRQLTLLPGTYTVWPGELSALEAFVYDERGQRMNGVAVEYTSSDTTVVRVDSLGRFAGMQPGWATVTGRVNTLYATSLVRVLAVPQHELLFEVEWFPGVPTLMVARLGNELDSRMFFGSLVWARDAAPSPDGARVAYAGMDGYGNIDIYVANRDGSGIRRVTTHAGVDDQPAWSPDGTRLAFRTQRGGYPEIYLIDADGTGEEELSAKFAWNQWLRADRPAWSPDGRVYLALGAGWVEYWPQLVSVRPDGSDVRTHTPEGASDRDPAFSPGGVLALRRSREGQPDWLMTVNDNGSQTSHLRSPGTGVRPAWSPDGVHIAFAAGDAAAPLLLTIADGDGFLPPVRKELQAVGRRAVWLPAAGGN